MLPFSAMDMVTTYITGQLMSLTNPIHRILGQFVNKLQKLFISEKLTDLSVNLPFFTNIT